MNDFEQDAANELKCFCPICHLVFENPSFKQCPECSSNRPDDGWGLLPYPFRNNFIIMEQLGRGGMGAVYKAISDETGQVVALKVARMDRDVEIMRHRFAREMAVANMLSERDRDSFVSVMSTDTMAPPYYMAMEFVNAPTLSMFVKKNSKTVKEGKVLPYMEVINLTDPILASLTVAHHHKIVHMDIKPDNIFVESMVSGTGKIIYHAKIADLGSCIFEDDESSKDNMILGTPGYMSPEQILGKDVKRSTDVFAVAAMIYEMITGSVPYKPKKDLHGIALIKGYLENMKTGRLHPSERIPPDFFSLLEKALAYKPSDRFNNAEEFRTALQDMLSSDVEKNKRDLRLIQEQKDILTERVERVRENLADILQVSSDLFTIEKKLGNISVDEQDIALQPLVVKAMLDNLVSEVQSLEVRMKAVMHGRGIMRRAGSKIAKGIKDLLTRDKYESLPGAPLLARGKIEDSVNISQITEVDGKKGKMPIEEIKLAVRSPVKILPPGAGRVLCLAYSPDDRLLATGSNKGMVAVFDLRHDGGPDVFRGHDDSIRSIGFDPTGKLLITAGWDKVIRIWDVKTKKEVESMFGHTLGLLSAWFSNDGQYIVSAGSDESLKVWSYPAGRIVNQVRVAHNELVSMVVSPDNETVIIGGRQGIIKKMSLPDLQPLGNVTGHDDAVRAMGISRDGRVLATGGADGMVKTWNLDKMGLIATLSGHKDWIRSIAVADEGKLVATGSNDRTLRLWRVNGDFLGVVGKTMPQIIPVGFSGDGTMLASGFESDAVALFSMKKFLLD